MSINVLKHATYSEIQLARPEVKNALDQTTMEAFSEALEQLESRGLPLVLSGQGGLFCAGADIQWMRSRGLGDKASNKADALVLANLLKALAEFPDPTICVAQGAAIGGAVGLVACCDFVIAAPSTLFKFSEVRLGIVPATISPYVVRAMGWRAANRYALCADGFKGDVAAQLGLVTHLDEDLSHVLEHLLGQLSQNGPAAMRNCKSLIGQADQLGPEATAEWLADIRSTAEAQAGLGAFFSGEQPQWERSDA